jgi:hypothetical protein
MKEEKKKVKEKRNECRGRKKVHGMAWHGMAWHGTMQCGAPW